MLVEEAPQAGVTVQATGQIALTYLPGLLDTAPIGGDVSLCIFVLPVADHVIAVDKPLWCQRA